jgi:hypothetical protein
MEQPDAGSMTPETVDVLERCRDAVQAAERCAVAASEAGDPAMARLVRLSREVGDLAELHARMLVRGSGLHAKVGQLCLDACLTCADECTRFDLDACQVAEPALRACAEACESTASGGPVDEPVLDDWRAHGGRSPFAGYFDEQGS